MQEIQLVYWQGIIQTQLLLENKLYIDIIQIMTK